MRLCVNCCNYKQDGNIVECSKDYWIVGDPIKSKIFNPMMYECLDYDSIAPRSHFRDDHVFDLFLTMSR